MSDYINLLRMLKTYEDGYGLYHDAAAAIEELQAERDEWIDRCYHSDEKVAELATKENITLTAQQLKEVVDYIINALKELK